MICLFGHHTTRRSSGTGRDHAARTVAVISTRLAGSDGIPTKEETPATPTVMGEPDTCEEVRPRVSSSIVTRAAFPLRLKSSGTNKSTSPACAAKVMCHAHETSGVEQLTCADVTLVPASALSSPTAAAMSEAVALYGIADEASPAYASVKLPAGGETSEARALWDVHRGNGRATEESTSSGARSAKQNQRGHESKAHPLGVAQSCLQPTNQRVEGY